jgi:hypothetical protein
VYEARKAFEQYDAVDGRNRLAPSELERRWNRKLKEIEAVKQRLSRLETERYTLSPEEETTLKPGPSQICRPSRALTRPSYASMIPTNVEPGPCRVRLESLTARNVVQRVKSRNVGTNNARSAARMDLVSASTGWGETNPDGESGSGTSSGCAR